MPVVGASDMRTDVGARRAFVRATGGLALLAAALATAESLRAPFVSFDTSLLIQTVDSALAHLHRGQFSDWGGKFPLLQAIPAFVLRAGGASTSSTLDVLIGLNVVAVALTVLASWRFLLEQSRTGALLVATVLLAGPLPWYAHSSFGEPLAALVTLASVIASWRSRGHLTPALFLFLAGISKDFAVPFLVLLTFTASIRSTHWSDRSFRVQRVGALLGAAIVSFLADSAYDYVRFGSIFDVPYLDPILFVPWRSTQAGFFAAVWLSPNGGVLLFWPAFGILLLLAIVAVLRAARGEATWTARLRSLAPAVAVAATLVGTTWVLADWVSPLGWAAWGPRLSLPWLPACAFLLVAGYSGELDDLLAGITGRLGAFTLGAILLAAATLPQYISMVRPTLWHLVFDTDAECPTVPLVQQSVTYYYHCTNHMLWTKGSVLLAAYSWNADPLAFVTGCGCAAGLLWLLYRLRASAASLGRAAPKGAGAGPTRGPLTGDAVSYRPSDPALREAGQTLSRR